ncbi:MAG: CBS domain-containing protein [Oligoflexia bacterium]|nr:CBS domain-containing protein [Oligoflexia bacterium]
MKTTAKDIMSSKMIVAKEKINVEDAVRLLVNHKITGLPVVDQSGKMLGVVSEYDIINQVGSIKSIDPKDLSKPISYTKNVESVTEDTLLEQVLEKFIKAKYRRLPVLDKEGNLKGIITRRDIMRVLYYRAKVNE